MLTTDRTPLETSKVSWWLLDRWRMKSITKTKHMPIHILRVIFYKPLIILPIYSPGLSICFIDTEKVKCETCTQTAKSQHEYRTIFALRQNNSSNTSVTTKLCLLFSEWSWNLAVCKVKIDCNSKKLINHYLITQTQCDNNLGNPFARITTNVYYFSF